VGRFCHNWRPVKVVFHTTNCAYFNLWNRKVDRHLADFSRAVLIVRSDSLALRCTTGAIGC